MFYIQTSLRRRNERFSERLLRGELIELSRSLEKTGRLISRVVGSRASSTNRRRLSLERILVDLNNRANLKLRFSDISSGVRSGRTRLFNNPLSNLPRLATRLFDLEMRGRRTDDIILFAHFLTALTTYPINMFVPFSTPPIRRVIQARRPDEIVVCTRRYVDLLLLLLTTITTWRFNYWYGINVCYDVENVFVVCWVATDSFITGWCAGVDFVMVVCWDVFGGRRLGWGRCYSATTTTSLITTICCRWTWHCCCRRRRMVQFSIDFFVSTL